MIKSLFAYQFAAYGTSNTKLDRLIQDTSTLTQLVDFYKGAVQSLKTDKQYQLNKAALLACYNVYTLDSDDYLDQQDAEPHHQSESLFKQFEKSHYLVSVHSHIINQLARIQKLKLQTAQSKQYMTLGERICTEEYKKSERKLRILEVVKNLEKNVDQFDIQSFKSKALNKRQPLALVIDMDLQFLLVPKEWIHCIVEP